MVETLQIDQALYGYQDGHRLLASSVELPPQADRAILPLSDGPDLQVGVPPRGFLSGYPVPDSDRFALSRTWPAPEMRRPGCVWTHVLLIANQDLAAIEDPLGLERYFQRPEGPEPDLSSYRQPIPVSSAADSGSIAEAPSSGSAEALLFWLYAQSDPVVLLGEGLAASEHQMLALWGQQWSELRRRFSFTSIATTREVSGRPFDLRIIPDPEDPVLFRSLGAEVHAAGEHIPSPHQWVSRAADDLLSPGELRRVLWRYGAEAGADRAAFAPIVGLHSAQTEKQPASTDTACLLLSLALAAFPGEDQMRGLKRDLFGEREQVSTSGRLAWHGSDAVMLSALITCEDQFALDPGDLGFDKRLQSLWREERDEAIQLLQLCAQNPSARLSNAALEVLLPLAASEPELLTNKAPAAVPLAINRDPDFATNSVVWSAPGADMDQRLRAVDSVPFLGKVRSGVLRAMLSADTPSVIEPAFNRWGVAMVGDLLEIAGERGAPMLTEGWIELLRAHPEATSKWFASRAERPTLLQLALVAETADPEEIARLHRPLGLWLELLKRGSVGKSGLTPRQIAFLFRLGLASEEPSAVALLTGTFRALRDLVGSEPRRGALLVGAGAQVKARKGKSTEISPVIAALTGKWQEEGWPLSALIEGEDEPLLIAEILRSYMGSKKGEKAIRKYLEAMPKKRSSKFLHALPSDLKDFAEKSTRAAVK
jgi:GTPase-associated protein 1, N-terminal domain type 1